VALLAVGERDRDLLDPEAGPDDAVRRLDLERVALRVDRGQVDRLEHAPAKALEAAGEVADPALQEDLRVDVPAERDCAAAEVGADLVLGSRYVSGGSIPNWGALRRFVSLGGNIYAQVFLQSRIRDLTGGFKCFRRRVLETIPLEEIDSKGYAFQIETTYRVRRAGFRVVEIPIAFTDREHGTSKMNGAIVLEAVWKVPLLRLRALGGRL